MGLMRTLNQKAVMQDTASFLEFLEQQPSVAGKVGCVGYCMGGGYALSAAGTFPNRIAAAASLHGAKLATDQPDSPHLLAPKLHGGVYVGIAGIDSHFTPEEKHRLESALQAASVKHTIEVYPNVKHGFAVNDHSPPTTARPPNTTGSNCRKLFSENLHFALRIAGFAKRVAFSLNRKQVIAPWK